MSGWRGPRDRDTTTERGYGSDHQRARAKAAEHHHPDDPCARCGHRLGSMGPWLHYDHDDQRTGYLGFSHGRYPCPTCGKRCNVVAGAQAGRAKQDQTSRTLRW